MNISAAFKKFGIERLINGLHKNPEKNLLKILDLIDKFAGNDFEAAKKAVREAAANFEHPYHSYIKHILNDIDPNVVKTTGTNFFINAIFTGWYKQERCREEYRCNIPWAILLDPTSACNLHCTGCPAANTETS